MRKSDHLKAGTARNIAPCQHHRSAAKCALTTTKRLY